MRTVSRPASVKIYNDPRLTLNFSPIYFDDVDIEAGVFEYGQRGDEQLQTLRRDHWRTHVFRRNGAFEIIAVPISPDAPRLGTAYKAISLRRNLGLAAALIRNSLLNFLYAAGRASAAFEPLRFQGKDDLLKEALSPDAPCPEWLALKLQYEIAIRPVYFFKHEPFVSAIIDVRTTRIIDRDVESLLALGFPIKGHYVTRRLFNDDPRIAPRFELFGKVEDVVGDRLLLSDSRDGSSSVQSKDVFLEKRAFNECLSIIFGDAVDAVSESLDRARTLLRGR